MRPESIENDWDILYRDYPEVYDRFAQVPKTPTWGEVVRERFDLADKWIVDVGCGSGLSCLQLAPVAQRVIGVELEPAMLAVAQETLAAAAVGNLSLLAGDANALPLADDSVDALTAVTLASLYYHDPTVAFCREAERVVRPGGVVITLNIAPGWYGGDLAEIVLGMSREQMEPPEREAALAECGYDWFDYFADQEYGSVEHAVATYGFIFGRRVIERLRAQAVHHVRWKSRVHYKTVGG